MKVVIDISKLPCKNGKSCTDCHFYTGDLCEVPAQLENFPKLEERTHGEWIPCSERLPDKTGFYLITNTDGVVKLDYFRFGTTDEFDIYYAVAWMPLPEPYKKEGDEK